jgi:hypothetical protein
VLDSAYLWKKVVFLNNTQRAITQKDIKERTQDKDIRLQDAQENIWNKWDELTEKWRKLHN